MKLIELSQNRVACVDGEDFEWLSKWTWHYVRAKRAKTGYARRMSGTRPHRQIILMHQAIWARHGKFSQVDHINGCGCDNRKRNFRPANASTQNANRRRPSNNTSGIKGICWYKQTERWKAHIRVDKKSLHLGYFIRKKDAIAARRTAELKHFGEYCHNPKLLCLLWKTGQCPECSRRAQELGLKP